ncbi:hypothetical protein ES332_D11G333400v1 [Gossypium tomentosum]|uniref:X8 domain-containing protein n=1 Tax=Gossypium tomentosum TaxID=34277 RepID=A0A5D2IWE1_GOSTO|nr:hypothetical protein ES332_D11G333400v1 [Gossypium tomentosum]
MMARGASNCLFLSPLFLLLLICSPVEISTRIAAFYVEVSTMADFVGKRLIGEEKKGFVYSRRELIGVKKTAQHDLIIPPPATFPTPNIINVPAKNPVETPAAIPATTQVMVPSTNPNNPTTVPVTNPVTTPAPITVPGAGAQQPVTNPVTTYPAPTGGVPASTPVTTNPLPPPVSTNAPAVPGQSWCVAKTGTSETSLQTALDYACGIADCSQIQQGANCYNPNTLQNHASYAFNSYYQKNPLPTSCDFGGTAAIVNTNPSSGSCIYPSSASASQSTPTATPVTPSSTSTGAGVPGSVVPPSVLNSSTPGSGSTTTSVFGSDIPPTVSTSMSLSVSLQPPFTCIILLTMTSFVAGFIFKN